MTYRNRISTTTLGLAACFSFLVSMVPAQTQRAQAVASLAKMQSRTVALVSDACPEVSAGDKVSLDWNPGFDHAGLVTGLRGFKLIVAHLREDGTEGKVWTELAGGGKGQPAVASVLPNGFFHIEIAIPSEMQHGVYRLVDAEASPSVYPGSENQSVPQMLVSPVRGRFCITVVPRTQQHMSQQ